MPLLHVLGRRLRRLVAGFALTFAALPAAAQAPLQLGIAPYLPTAALFDIYEPLRRHLAEKLGRPLEVSTAPNFREFALRARDGAYDLAVISPGIGHYLEKDAGYLPLAVSRREIHALLMVRSEAGIASIADLRYGRVASLDPFTVMNQLGRQLLRQGGVDPEREIRFEYVSTSYNAARALLLGEVEAIVLPSTVQELLPAEMRARLRVLAQSAALPGIAVYARKGAPLPRPETLAAWLVAFGEASETGRRFMREARLDGLRPPAPGEFRMLDAFLPEMRRLLTR